MHIGSKKLEIKVTTKWEGLCEMFRYSLPLFYLT